MCNQWALKMKACGHAEQDLEILPCPNPLAAWPIPCPVCYHSVEEIRPLTPGDSNCKECRERAYRLALDNTWLRATGNPTNLTTYTAFRAARAYLLGLFTESFITAEHANALQQKLVFKYVDDDTVMDVPAALRELGYDVPRPRVRLNFKREENREAGRHW
ncbi:hypothetical protein F4776DRAFT_45317 [Hypoxylon sp. NC0597]|nr:hypothetical protein F4776DRAFT_45317 [Hypoxylon sp. NC0597]